MKTLINLAYKLRVSHLFQWICLFVCLISPLMSAPFDWHEIKEKVDVIFDKNKKFKRQEKKKPKIPPPILTLGNTIIIISILVIAFKRQLTMQLMEIPFSFQQAPMLSPSILQIKPSRF
jgi:hypothetical protein